MSSNNKKNVSAKTAKTAAKASMKSPRKAIPAVKRSVTATSAAKSPAGRGGSKGKGRVAAGKEHGRVAAMWAGRFSQGMSPSMEALSVSLPFDRKLFREDIEGSIAHAHGLHAAKVLTTAERDRMIAGLKEIMVDIAEGQALFTPSDEDIHMAVERILTDRIGDLGKKLHTGRSRNDQVATDFRLYVMRRAEGLVGRIEDLQRALLAKAKEYKGDIMPGYTHVQQAQPILIAHYLLSFFFALERDKSRLRHAWWSAGEMPLGSGALAGSAFPYKRTMVAERLGFPAVSRNSIDATAHRDFALEFLGALGCLGVLMSSYAEDFVIWSTSEFGYIKLGEAYTSGSSMMPQKRNPDSMELIRGKAGRLVGAYARLFTVLKGLPHAYDRDLQEDKEPVFDAVETASVCLQVMAEAIESLKFETRTILAKMQPALLATDLADILVEKGVPFRDAHHIVGRLVGEAEQKGVSFLELPAASWKAVPDAAAVRKQLTFSFSVERRNIQGGTGSKSVAAQIREAERILKRVG
jgi:argininosuccinate lyase